MTIQLPHYRSPPLIEVVCGVQFEPLAKFSTAHFGDFRNRVRSEYPGIEDRPPLPEVIEQVGGVRAIERIDVSDLPPLRRVFFIDESNNFLLQVQASRFLSNWRKVGEADAYPRFDTARTRFERGWESFRSFVSDLDLGPIRANQYELTYINHLVSSVGFPTDWRSFLKAAPWSDDRDFLPAPVAGACQLTFRLPEDKGMLRAIVNHGRRDADGKQVMTLELTARGPAATDTSDRDEWFATAHQWIVRGFTDLTTATAHASWERAT